MNREKNVGPVAIAMKHYYRIDPPQGSAFQRVYTDDRTLDETLCVSDG